MGGVFIVLKTNPLAYLHLGLAARQLQKLYVFGLHLYGSGKETGKFYEQTFDMRPWIFCKFPSYPSKGPPTMRTFLPIISEDISSGV